MSKIIISLCLIFLATGVSARLTNSRQLSSWFWSDGKGIKLTYNNETNQYWVKANLPNTQNANMMLSLSGTDNIVVKRRSVGFTAFPNAPTANDFTTVNIAHPYLKGSGSPIAAAIQVPLLENSMMNVQQSKFQSNNGYGAGNNAILVNSLSTSNIATMGNSAYGYLSMSVDSMTSNNIGDTFSVYLDKFNQSGFVIFDKDLSYSRDILYTASWTTNGSWATQGSIQTKVGSTDLGNNQYNLIFDINQNITGVPRTLFNSIITALATYGVTGCTPDIVRPICNYNGVMRDLPHITLKNVGGANTWFSQNIDIPPRVYVAGTKQFGGVLSQITLNFMALVDSSANNNNRNLNNINDFGIDSPYTSTNNPGAVQAGHGSDIILDASILSHYYTLFETNKDGSGTVTMYVASGSAYRWFYYNWPRWCKVLFVLLVVLIVKAIIIAACYSAKRRRLQAAAQ